METNEELTGILVAQKCYDKFCDELVTAFDNMASIQKQIGFNAVMERNDAKTYYQTEAKREAFQEISERIKKERNLQSPFNYRDYLNNQYVFRTTADSIVDKVFPFERTRGRADYHVIENMKNELGKLIEIELQKTFELGMKYKSVEE